MKVSWLGTVPFTRAWDLQTETHAARAAGEVADTLFLLQHPHTFTVGRRGSVDDVLWDAPTLQARGVEVVETDRGGQVTYHGPGQLVGYPIVDLGGGADLVGYLRKLEDVLIATLDDLGVAGHRLEGATGVWVGNDKIAAFGVRVTRGVTKHGFALNVSCDLSYFAGIIPCGITDKGVTSVEAQLGSAPDVRSVADITERHMRDVFERIPA